MPIVILFSLSTLAGLAAVGAVRVLRSSSASLRPAAASVGADVHRLPRVTGDALDSIAVHPAA